MTRAPSIALATATLLLAAGCGGGDPTAPRPATQTLSPKTPQATAPTNPEVINQQDRFTKAERRRHERAMTQQPLLNHLPLRVRGVTIDIGGLAAHDRPLITLTAPGRSDGYAQSAYRDALEQFKDSGRAYEVKVTR